MADAARAADARGAVALSADDLGPRGSGFAEPQRSPHTGSSECACRTGTRRLRAEAHNAVHSESMRCGHTDPTRLHATQPSARPAARALRTAPPTVSCDTTHRRRRHAPRADPKAGHVFVGYCTISPVSVECVTVRSFGLRYRHNIDYRIRSI